MQWDKANKKIVPLRKRKSSETNEQRIRSWHSAARLPNGIVHSAVREESQTTPVPSILLSRNWHGDWDGDLITSKITHIQPLNYLALIVISGSAQKAALQ